MVHSHRNGFARTIFNNRYWAYLLIIILVVFNYDTTKILIPIGRSERTFTPGLRTGVLRIDWSPDSSTIGIYTDNSEYFGSEYYIWKYQLWNKEDGFPHLAGDETASFQWRYFRFLSIPANFTDALWSYRGMYLAQAALYLYSWSQPLSILETENYTPEFTTFSVDGGEQTNSLESVSSVTWNHQSETLLASTLNGSIYKWSETNSEELTSTKLGSGSISKVLLNHADSLLATNRIDESENQSLNVYSYPSYDIVSSQNLSSEIKRMYWLDNTTLAYLEESATHLKQINTITNISTNLMVVNDTINNFDVDPSGTLLAIVKDGIGYFYTIPSKQLVYTLFEDEPIDDIRFSPGGSMFAYNTGQTIKIREVSSFSIKYTLPGYEVTDRSVIYLDPIVFVPIIIGLLLLIFWLVEGRIQRHRKIQQSRKIRGRVKENIQRNEAHKSLYPELEVD
ncbi:MAG: hypothetical protein ACXAB7_17835 [Candidatus Kariarchaeaceae archaeon]